MNIHSCSASVVGLDQSVRSGMQSIAAGRSFRDIISASDPFPPVVPDAKNEQTFPLS